MPVVLGKEERVLLQLSESGDLLVDKASKNRISRELVLEPSVDAPVEAGQQLGTLLLKDGEKILKELPLVASGAVDRLTWGDLFVKILGRAAMAKV